MVSNGKNFVTHADLDLIGSRLLAEAASAERPFGLIGQGLLLLHSFLKSQIRSSVFYLPKIPEH